ncbi:unnamed protein product [Larinioides sclopetarius]|uniref:WH2 domain-containing protein n=1 Tax=Larinioides sclopetarius TaxID=280406 RepID=A0AAV1YQN3_9ARAC
MPPPPPPPPAPPPIPKQPLGGSSAQSKNNFEPPPDRNALLSQIRKGTRLKKAETNDKSAPIIDGSKSLSTNGAAKPSAGNKANGPFPLIPPGGLFAQGIPKLRPTTPRNGEGLSQSTLKIQSIKSGSSTSSLDHLRVGQLSGSRSQPPSPVSKPRMTTGVSSYRTANSDTSNTGGNPDFPDDLNIKGPAPAPPPASQKPVFKTNANAEQIVNKPSTVKRSASQTNLGQRPRLTRPPPNVKPPPPPKSNPTPNPPQSGPPPPPSKPPNILRRQSFGVGESHNSRFAANKLSVANNDTPKPTPKSIGPPPPPPPPRNNSAPNDLNQMVTSSSPSNQWSKMSTAPPPPPNRAVATSNRNGPIRPPPPRAPAPPPPPPQHQFSSHPAPPSQMKATLSVNNTPPPPPARVSSMKQASSFEERFKFQSAQSLPKPDKYPNTQKTYPSRANRQKQGSRRQPPPPPPQSAVDPNPRLHIQLNSGIFSSNYAHS